MNKRGAFTFVLHSHIPYARMAGRWPHGEEWVHEAATDTYIPLLAALHDLAAEGVRYRLTISITPVLAEQLADPDIVANLDAHLEEMRERAESDIARFDANGEHARRDVARWYRERFIWLLGQFRDRFGRDLIAAFRWLQENGYAELATSAATHGYLPLFARDSSIHAQVATGVRTYERHFGRAPASFWLPECAYRPAYTAADGTRKPGIEEFLAAQGVTTFFVETHAVLGGKPVGKAAGDAVGLYGEVPRRYTVPHALYEKPTERTTFQPYWVSQPRVAAIGRNLSTGLQVWSAEHGYPGDFNYREFHKKDSETGLQYWRVTGAKVELGDKALYDPDAAFDRAREHARHFASLVESQVTGYASSSGQYGIVSAAYDTELFGHWWYEGVEWLKDVLRILAASDIVDLTGAAQFVAEHPPEEVVTLPEGSWGQEGTHFVWDNDDTRWMWPIINDAQERIEEAAERDAGKAALAPTLQQLARELLLLESSDWPFLVTTGQARDYAVERFGAHHDRFRELLREIEAEQRPGRYVEELWRIDRVFPDIQIQDFRQREGIAGATAPAVR